MNQHNHKKGIIQYVLNLVITAFSVCCFIYKDQIKKQNIEDNLYSKLVKKMSKARIHEIIKEAVEIESEFICDALPCRLIGMNSQMMTQYIQFVADRLSVQLGYDKIYNVANPFDWMEASYFYYRPKDLVGGTGVGKYLDKGFNVKFKYKSKNNINLTINSIGTGVVAEGGVYQKLDQNNNSLTKEGYLDESIQNVYNYFI